MSQATDHLARNTESISSNEPLTGHSSKKNSRSDDINCISTTSDACADTDSLAVTDSFTSLEASPTTEQGRVGVEFRNAATQGDVELLEELLPMAKLESATQ